MAEENITSGNFPQAPVLLVDDEEQFLFSAVLTLESEGIDNVVSCQNSRDVMSLLAQQDFSAIALDMRMPYISGWELLPKIRLEYPHIPVLILTAVNEVETAVECMKSGGFDYLVKPVSNTKFVTAIRRAVEHRALQDENARLKHYLLSDTLEHPEVFSDIITQDRAMFAIFQYIEAIATSPMPVLITGETGVGKELVARSIHKLSGRQGSLVAFNAAGVDDHLFSDTLFGHERGAFTGAERARKGLLEQASGGTLLLDESGDLSIESQVKLLRLLEEGKYYPLGADTLRASDARFIVATNRGLESMVADGQFRRDLYYRLQTYHIRVPALRERRGDIPLLISHFLAKAAETLGKRQPTPPKELRTLLGAYHFPGNIRELESMVLDAVTRHKSGVLSMDAFREKVDPNHSNPMAQIGEPESAESERLTFAEPFPTLKEAEHLLIEKALERADGNQTIAAQLLGLSRAALNKRLSRARGS